MSSKMHFDSAFSFEKSIHVIRDIVSHLPGDNHDILSAIDRREWTDLVQLRISYDRPLADVRSLSGRRQALAFFSKNASVPLGIKTQKVALGKFLESEELCKATNNRFRNRSLPAREGGLDAGLIFEVMRKIADILGPMPGLDKLSFGFGPGANVGVKRLTSLRRKFAAQPTVTPGALKYVPYLQEAFPDWRKLEEFRVVSGGTYASVPKTALTDRSILVEPLINTFLQKGVGKYIRERLRNVGVNLSDQSINQKKAREGSLYGYLATLDLSMASDTISREVVAALLPHDWWLLLEDLRSQRATLPDGREIVLQKFSSMGNGFTFELESLIFFAIATVVASAPSEVSIYGDDIICTVDDVKMVTYALEHFGFRLNSDKSFWTGDFRESCGRDYFGGIDIRPCYVKGRLSVKEMFRLHNFFVRNNEEALAQCCLHHVPTRFVIYGPDGFGDGHLLGDHSTLRSRKAKRNGYGGYRFSTYATSPRLFDDETVGDWPAFLWMTTVQHGDQTKGSLDTSDWVLPWDIADFDECDPLVELQSEASISIYQERDACRYRMQSVYTY